MDATVCDRLARVVAVASSRRGILRGFAALSAPALVGLPDTPKAKNRGRKNRKARGQRPRLNAFGCLDVGTACTGNDAACCSGICTGTRPRKGQRDTSRCGAHNTGGCLAAEQSCGADVPDTPCGAGGFCLRTTGNAGFCGDVSQGGCAACRRDVDCQGAFGAGAACAVCPNSLCPETGNRVCVVPAA